MPQTDTDTYIPQDGDEVEVTLRGKIGGVSSADEFFWIGEGRRRNSIHPAAAHVASITKLATPWQVGDVIRVGDETRVLRVRSGALEWVDAQGARHADVGWYDSEHGYDYRAVIRGGQVVSS